MRISDWSSDVCSSDLNFSWWRRSRGNSSSRRARETDFMNGAGPQQKASYVVKLAANALSCSSEGSPWTDSSQCTTMSRSGLARSEEHTSELQSLMRISYAVFCL